MADRNPFNDASRPYLPTQERIVLAQPGHPQSGPLPSLSSLNLLPHSASQGSVSRESASQEPANDSQNNDAQAVEQEGYVIHRQDTNSYPEAY